MWTLLTVCVRLHQHWGAGRSVSRRGETQHGRLVPRELLQVAHVTVVTRTVELRGDGHNGGVILRGVLWPGKELQKESIMGC